MLRSLNRFLVLFDQYTRTDNAGRAQTVQAKARRPVEAVEAPRNRPVLTDLAPESWRGGACVVPQAPRASHS